MLKILSQYTERTTTKSTCYRTTGDHKLPDTINGSYTETRTLHFLTEDTLVNLVWPAN